MSRF
jgi:hypothetical protein